MISFVGAGPGAADLITLRGADRLAKADIVIWASSLVPEALLGHCHDGVTVHDSATMTLEDVLEVYEASPDARIVRLHSGDPAVYGAIQEQIDWCVARERSFEIVPGVTSVAGAAAEIGRELTIPKRGQSVVLTRPAGRTAASMRPGEELASFATHGTTMAVFLAGARPDEIQADLLGPTSGYTADTPAVVLVRATWPDQQIVRTNLGGLADAIRSTGATMTVLVLVGDVLDERPVEARSHLYDPSYTTTYRLRSAAGTTEGRASRHRRSS
ncbi:MAG: precorrin-4 C(11)-methyltransferase [Actinomycetota bacterium]|nr:precorrin-4 C(11)-methyltransferase [Actinomycetota bacterium]